MPELYICGPRDKPKVTDDILMINTTSSSKDWSRGLSPFILGPCLMYGGLTARNVENAHQYSKAYQEIDGVRHVNNDGNPTQAWYDWALRGFQAYGANRYPAGKGAIPLYSFWDGKKYNYIEARKGIFYFNAVVNTSAFAQLREISTSGISMATITKFSGRATTK